MKTVKLHLFIGRDKGRALVIVAPNEDNAKTMVDANTKLHWLGVIFANAGFNIQCQGEIDAEKILNVIEDKK